MLEPLEDAVLQFRKALIRQYMDRASGVLHIGGHKGQEAVQYASYGRRVLWIEASPAMFKTLKKNIDGYTDQRAFCACLSNTSGAQTTFYISNNADGASSSIFEFGVKSEGDETLWPHLNLHMVDELTLPTTRLDDLFEQNDVDAVDYNYWVLDVQGAEKLVLEGAGKSLEKCQAIYAEISLTEVYKGGVLWEELCSYLELKGFLPLFDPVLEHDDVLFARASVTNDLISEFHSTKYQEHTKRRQEHLASLGLDLFNKSVLELGAGNGDHSGFFLDRHCDVTITDVRPEAISMLEQRFWGTTNAHILPLDMEYPKDLGRTFEIVYCYGLLYHLSDPVAAIEYMARHCSGLLLIETCVSVSAGGINSVEEPIHLLSQSFYGKGCRPSRRMIWDELKKHMKYVYMPKTQPAHAEFPLDWTVLEEDTGKLQRAIFMASNAIIESPRLSEVLIDKQVHMLRGGE